MALTLPQMEQADLQAGWPTDLVPTAAAVEEAESSGNPDAIGPGGSWGLFQIQPQAHPDIAQTSDPVGQSRAGLQVYQSQGWNAWSVYGNAPGHNNAYAQYLPAAQAVAGAAGSAPNSGTAPGKCTPQGWQDAKCGGLDIGCALQNLWGGFSCTLRNQLKHGMNGVQMVLGLVVLGFGLWLLVKDTDLGKRIAAPFKSAGKAALAVAR